MELIRFLLTFCHITKSPNKMSKTLHCTAFKPEIKPWKMKGREIPDL